MQINSVISSSNHLDFMNLFQKYYSYNFHSLYNTSAHILAFLFLIHH